MNLSFCFLTIVSAVLFSAAVYADEKGTEGMVQDQLTSEQNKMQPGMYDKGFILKSEDEKFLMKINGRMQSRFLFQSDKTDDGKTETTTKQYNFSVPRARLKLEGTAFTKDLSYLFQAEFGKSYTKLLDYMVDYSIYDGWLHVRTGQWKKPFSRQQINSSGNMQFPDRAITDKNYSAGRDIGFAVGNSYEKSPEIEWALGVFNGTGIDPALTGDVTVDLKTGKGTITKSSLTNVPTEFNPAIVARAGYNYGGIKGYSEADLEGGDLRFSVAAGCQVIGDFKDNKSGKLIPEADFMLKMAGFSATGAFYMMSKQTKGGYFNQARQDMGFHVQAGYVINGMFEPVVRAAMIIPKSDAMTKTGEYLGGLNLYFFKHNAKIQASGGVITQKTGDVEKTSIVSLAQFQLAF
jgi:hypothetical protein